MNNIGGRAIISQHGAATLTMSWCHTDADMRCITLFGTKLSILIRIPKASV